MNSAEFERVGRDFACPICNREDWCLRTHDGAVALCQRIAEGSVRRVGEAGWLHRQNGADWRPSGPRRVVISSGQARATRSDLAELADAYRRSVRPGRLARLAGNLGVSPDSLARLGIGWCEGSRAWSFPMTDAWGNVLGIRLRTESGRKFAVRGGREGLFIPEGAKEADLLLVAEGATDTAALLDLGFPAMGRASCRGGWSLLLELVERRPPKTIVIVADNDPQSQGLDGATSLARRLASFHSNARVIAPPLGSKDVREWVRSGADRDDVFRRIDRTCPFVVSISTRPLHSASAGEAFHVG